MKVIMIDNYDSFTYNLVQYTQELLGHKIDVHRNDQVTLNEVERYDKIILSPGPGLPKDAGVIKEVIQVYAGSKPILGVCLGMQAIAEVFGATLKNLDRVYHGVESSIKLLKNDTILGNEKELKVGRYHSWAVDEHSDLSKLEVLAKSEDDNCIMAIKHIEYECYGLQFHPESVLTPSGKTMIKNFLNH